MDFEKVAHDIAISLLPRALDRHPAFKEWQDADNDVQEFANKTVASEYFNIYSSVLYSLEEEYKNRKDR